MNEEIRAPEVLLIDDQGIKLGVVPTKEALKLAEERLLDLVEVAPQATPPVCRIMDYGKYKYELSKKARKARQQAHTQKIKTIKFRPKTDDHDYDFKKRHILTFLQEGNKVRVIMQYRGREISHVDLGIQFLQRLIEEVGEFGAPETTPQLEGRTVTFILAPRKGG